MTLEWFVGAMENSDVCGDPYVVELPHNLNAAANSSTATRARPRLVTLLLPPPVGRRGAFE